MSIIQGTAYWASVTQPNTTYEPVWSVDVGNLSAAAKKTLKADGLGDKIKNKDDEKGDFINIKQKVNKRDGSTFEPPKVVDGMKRPFASLIGNGSEVAVKYTAREWEYNGKAGITADLKAVQVIKHIPYGDGEDFDTIGGNDLDDIPFDDVPMTAAG
jgi:hypothetical protein|tara:strand:+ start:2363 stop:2833 length:471 start_codon:yes stop_codon:yes gene_type:complete